MRISAVRGVTDEIKLIGPLIAYLRAIGLDHVIFSDAGSWDNTAEILDKAARGEAFELMPIENAAYDDGGAEPRFTAEALTGPAGPAPTGCSSATPTSSGCRPVGGCGTPVHWPRPMRSPPHVLTRRCWTTAW